LGRDGKRDSPASGVRFFCSGSGYWSQSAVSFELEMEPGKYADFVILDTDLMFATPKEILHAKIESTWINGEKVFGF